MTRSPEVDGRRIDSVTFAEANTSVVLASVRQWYPEIVIPVAGFLNEVGRIPGLSRLYVALWEPEHYRGMLFYAAGDWDARYVPKPHIPKPVASVASRVNVPDRIARSCCLPTPQSEGRINESFSLFRDEVAHLGVGMSVGLEFLSTSGQSFSQLEQRLVMDFTQGPQFDVFVPDEFEDHAVPVVDAVGLPQRRWWIKGSSG